MKMKRKKKKTKKVVWRRLEKWLLNGLGVLYDVQREKEDCARQALVC